MKGNFEKNGKVTIFQKTNLFLSYTMVKDIFNKMDFIENSRTTMVENIKKVKNKT